jgi:MFS family permease
MTFMGFVTNWSGLMAARWWLGFAEAGLFPGVNYYLSCWYKRSEFGIRAVSFTFSLYFDMSCQSMRLIFVPTCKIPIQSKPQVEL